MAWPAIAAAGISAAASIGSSLLQNASNSQAASAGRDYGYQIAGLNYKAQKEFAQNGIRWRVADAKAAGLHPLAALGAAPLGFSPSFSADGMPATADDYSWINNVGQNIGRAIEAKATARERAETAAYESQARQLDIENKQLQNDALRQRIIDNALASMRALRTQAGQPPTMQQLIPTGRDGRTLPGQGDAHSLFEVKPVEIQASEPTRPHAEAASVPEVRYARTADGGYAPVRSQALEEALEDDWLGSIAWNIRNKFLPSAWDSAAVPPPDDFLPSGYDRWTYNMYKQAWYPVKKGESVFKKKMIPF